LATNIHTAPPNGLSSEFARARRPQDWLVPLVPAVVALVAGLYRIGTPALWRDEAATISASRRPLGDLLRMLTHVDSVHSLYYLIMHLVTSVLGTGAVAVRLPSALAIAATAGLIAVLGRRLAGTAVGVAAGLLLGLSNPVITRFAQEARSYALCAMLAVLATLLLVRALERGDRRSYAWYGVVVVLLGFMHLFTLLLLAAHAVTWWVSPGGRKRSWPIAAGAAVAVLLPFGLFSQTQDAQVSWLLKPTVADFRVLVESLTGASRLLTTLPVIALCAVGLLRPARPPGGADLRWVALPWAVLPPLILITASFVHPFYIFRYVLYCIPAVSLLTAYGLSRIPWRPALPIGVALLVVMVTQAQIGVRSKSGRADDLRKLASILATHEQPGDAIVYHHIQYRRVNAAYPAAYKNLIDVALKTDPVTAGNFNGIDVNAATLAQRLQSVNRVFFVHSKGTPVASESRWDRVKEQLVQHGAFVQTGAWQFQGGWVYLYVRR
jgi:mannosyltransferase